MMRASMMVAVLALLAAPALAEEGRVSNAKLKALGLNGMTVMSDAEGMQVRGMSSNASSGGASLIVGQIAFSTAEGNVFTFGSDYGFGFGSGENAGLNALTTALHNRAAQLVLALGTINIAGIGGGTGVGTGQ